MISGRIIGILLVLSSVVGACVRVAPPELVSARSAYLRTSNGPAPSSNPRDMAAATNQLQIAEDSFASEGDTDKTRDAAYLALRKLEYAEVVARTRQTDQATSDTVEGNRTREVVVVPAPTR